MILTLILLYTFLLLDIFKRLEFMGGPDYVGECLRVLTSIHGCGELYEGEFEGEHLLMPGAEPDVGPDTLLQSFVSSSGLNGQFSIQLRSGDRLEVEPNSESRILFSKA